MNYLTIKWIVPLPFVGIEHHICCKLQALYHSVECYQES